MKDKYLINNRHLVANSIRQVNYNLEGYYPEPNYTETLTVGFNLIVNLKYQLYKI
jgi:hypothetical protein